MAAKYAWDKWFTQRKFTVKQGRDYKCATQSMAMQIRTAALKRGFWVYLTVKGGTITAIVNKYTGK
jgi:hypothetical protein